MAHVKNHDYHILNPSIWPLLGSVSGFVMLFGAVLWFHDNGPWMFLIGFVGVLYVMFGWWSEVIAESRVGDHTPVVRIGWPDQFIEHASSVGYLREKHGLTGANTAEQIRQALGSSRQTTRSCYREVRETLFLVECFYWD